MICVFGVKNIFALSLDHCDQDGTTYGMKLSLSKKMEEYAGTLTIHGLSRIYTGNPAEKLIWSAFLLAAAFTTGIIVYGFITKYQKYEVYQSISTTPTIKPYYPQITFCLSAFHPKWQAILCRQIHTAKCTELPKKKTLNKTKSSNFWSNHIFMVKQILITNNSINFSINSIDIISHEETNGTCITWHFKKTLHETLFTYSFLMLELYVPKDLLPSNLPDVSVAISEQNTSGIHLRPQFYLKPGDFYHIKLSKTVTIRKPKPYKSQCTFKTKQHYFSGLYNQQVCKTVNYDFELYERKGTTLEFTRHLFPRALNNNRLNETQLERKDTTITSMNCPLACKETSFEISILETKSTMKTCIAAVERIQAGSLKCDSNRSTRQTTTLLHSSLGLSYLHSESYTTIEEKELYQLSQLLAEVGGFLGLMVGASCLSILEILICTLIVVLRRFFN